VQDWKKCKVKSKKDLAANVQTVGSASVHRELFTAAFPQIDNQFFPLKHTHFAEANIPVYRTIIDESRHPI
jgi:hypothetical protein